MAIAVTDRALVAAVGQLQEQMSQVLAQLQVLQKVPPLLNTLTTAIENLNATGAAVTDALHSAKGELVDILQKILADLESPVGVGLDPTISATVAQTPPVNPGP